MMLGEPSGYVGPCRAVACAAGAVHRASSQLLGSSLHPSWPLSIAGWAFRACPTLGGFVRSFKMNNRSDPRGFTFTFRAPYGARDVPLGKSASLGIHLGCPASDVPDHVTSRVALPRLFGRPESHPTARSALVVFHHPSGLLHRSSSGRIASQCQTGFASFQLRCRHREPTRRPVLRCPQSRIPDAPFTPLEEVPPVAAVSRLRDRCLLGVAPLDETCRNTSRRATLTFKALLRYRVRSAQTLFPASEHPLLPWAWFPSRALKPTTRHRDARPPSRHVSACSTTQPPPERPNRFPDSVTLVIPVLS